MTITNLVNLSPSQNPASPLPPGNVKPSLDVINKAFESLNEFMNTNFTSLGNRLSSIETDLDNLEGKTLNKRSLEIPPTITHLQVAETPSLKIPRVETPVDRFAFTIRNLFCQVIGEHKNIIQVDGKFKFTTCFLENDYFKSHRVTLKEFKETLVPEIKFILKNFIDYPPKIKINLRMLHIYRPISASVSLARIIDSQKNTAVYDPFLNDFFNYSISHYHSFTTRTLTSIRAAYENVTITVELENSLNRESYYGLNIYNLEALILMVSPQHSNSCSLRYFDDYKEEEIRKLFKPVLRVTNNTSAKIIPFQETLFSFFEHPPYPSKSNLNKFSSFIIPALSLIAERELYNNDKLMQWVRILSIFKSYAIPLDSPEFRKNLSACIAQLSISRTTKRWDKAGLLELEKQFSSPNCPPPAADSNKLYLEAMNSPIPTLINPDYVGRLHKLGK